jgi:hypothetical protein
MPSYAPPATPATPASCATATASATPQALTSWRRCRWILPALSLLGASALGWAPGTGGPSLGGPRASAGVLARGEAVQPVELPVVAVTVYSDRARVTRMAKVPLKGGAGGTRVELPILPSGVDPSSIRVEVDAARGEDAAVQRVELAWVDASEGKLPPSEAEKLLRELESIDDQLTTLRAEQAAYSAQLRLLGRVLPSASGLGQGSAPGQAPPAKLNPTGWAAVFAWTRQLYERVHQKAHEVEEKQRLLQLKRTAIVAEGQKLGGLLRRAGYRVTATLTGSGTAHLELSYQVRGARWRPTYDIQLLPGQNKVELSLAGLVSQETGEDWTDARLTLSTAVPATATQLPKLLTWKLGERERFIPTPQPQRETVPPAPVVPQLPPAIDADPNQLLQQRFASRLGLGYRGPTGGTYKRDANKNLEDTLAKEADAPAEAEELRESSGEKQEVDRDGVPDAEDRQTVMPIQAVPPPPPPPPPSGAPAAPGMQTEQLAQRYEVMAKPQSRVYGSVRGSASATSARRVAEVIGFGLAPPPGYQPPPHSTTLLASASGGYDMVFPSLAPDTVKSGHGTRRVALLSRSFPVEVSRKIMPALAPEAFLVADIRNPGTDPLPGGQAQLFVGADPAGVAQLKLMAPGEVISLPLGLDRAIRPARNVQVSTIEKGVFSKDEVSEYVVTTEVVNPYRVPLATRIYDQVPLVGDKNVEIKLLRTEPQAGFDDKTGMLEWRPSIPPGAKLVTKFVYTLTRPKGYKLSQTQY